MIIILTSILLAAKSYLLQQASENRYPNLEKGLSLLDQDNNLGEPGSNSQTETPIPTPTPIIVYKTVPQICPTSTPVVCPDNSAEISKKDDEIKRLKAAVALLDVNNQSLQASVFYWQSQANLCMLR